MLFAWLIKEKKFVLFGESDGAILNEYLSKPQLLSMQGDIYMGGVKGLLRKVSPLLGTAILLSESCRKRKTFSAKKYINTR